MEESNKKYDFLLIVLNLISGLIMLPVIMWIMKAWYIAVMEAWKFMRG